MSSNILPPRGGRKRKQPVAAPPPEPIQQPKKPRKMNMGNEMRRKNRRVSSPMV